jgi:3-oxoacyl-[acyl-carrier protein] reductase
MPGFDRLFDSQKDAADPSLAHAWTGDLAQKPECDRLLAYAHKHLGLITRFVHSASPPRHEKDHLLEVTGETWERMRSVNLNAGFLLGREIARALIASKTSGSMLYLTSLHAETPRNLPHYSTSKAAMAMLVKEMARMLGQHSIRVNALVPGAIAAGGFVADPALARHIPLGWRWRCCRTRSRVTSRARASSWTAGSR